jgi:hypothetical protein
MSPTPLGLMESASAQYTFDVDFTKYATGGITAPTLLTTTSLTFARALNATGTSETVQTSNSTILTSGLTADVARIGQFTSTSVSRGLVIEEPRQQWFPQNRQMISPPLTAGSAPIAGSFTAADGGTVSNRCQQTNTNYSNYFFGATSHECTFSAWGRSGLSSGTSDWNMTSGDGTGGGTISRGLAGIDQTWRRLVVPWFHSGPFSMACAPNDGRAWTGGLSAGARDAVVDLMQVEQLDTLGTGGYATEVILNPTNLSTTRLDEYLSHLSPIKLSSAGRLSFYAKVIPKGSSTQYVTTNTTPQKRIWMLDSNNLVYFDATTGKLTIKANGSSWTPSTVLSWNANDVVEFWIDPGSATVNAQAKYRVNGGSTIDLGNSGSPLGNLLIGARIDFFSDHTTSSPSPTQFSCWLQRLSFYPFNKKPSWA